MNAKRLLVALIFGLFVATSAFAQKSVSGENFRTLLDMMQVIESESYYQPTAEEMQAFYSCMLARAFARFEFKKDKLKRDVSLPSCFPKDKYARYLPPQAVVEEKKQMEGGFVGIGAEVDSVKEGVLIKELMPGGPAEKSGLFKENDIITAVGESADTMTSLADMPLPDAVGRTVGPAGSVVHLEIIRDGHKLPVITIARGEVKLQEVEVRDLGGIMYLKLFEFMKTNLVAEDLRQPFLEFSRKGTRALIIDLRGNPGGQLGTAMDFLSGFVPESGMIMFETRDRSGAADEPIISTGRGPFAGWTIVVLVDEKSASASEVSAGNLQYWGHTVVGTKTFGKGSMQTGFPLTGDGVLFLTTRHYFLGNGTSPDGVGIMPNVEVADNLATPEDEVLEKAKEIILQKKQ